MSNRVRRMRVLPSLLLLLLAVVAGCSKSGASDHDAGATDVDKYAIYLTRYPFGGRTLEWWQERLRSLAPGGASADPALFALTVERARKNGLEVSADNVVKPGAALTAVILKRSENP